MFFTHSFILIVVALATLHAITVSSKPRNRSAFYNPRQVLFTFFSSVSWVFWGLQCVILLVGPFTSFPGNFFQNIGLWLALMQNVLWATAVLSLYSNQFAKMHVTLPPLMLTSIVMVLIASQESVLTELYIYIDHVLAASIFLAFACTVLQLRLSKVSTAMFFIHGYSQWIWRDLWFSPLPAPLDVLIPFVFWHILLLIAWSKLIFEMVIIFRVMISSTLNDLLEEREEVGRTIRQLNLGRIEYFGRPSDNPEKDCALWAAQCDIFILLIGERYGSLVPSKKISFVEFEHAVGYKEDPGKILRYDKEGVTREPKLEEFLTRLDRLKTAYVKSSFTTVIDLSQQVKHDVSQWLASRRQLLDK